MYVIGTAGHVDHGKSTLVRALTGIDPDRLKEEKAREMTIDLGFAWLDLPGRGTVGIIDVPGHRDFIENMLAGVGGIDAVMFVVAADEGVMPQTREHLAIVDLLKIPTGVVALTKTDLVPDADWLELVQLDLTDLLAPTVLHDAPMIPVSARQGTGLETLKQALADVLATRPTPQDNGQARLWVDRVFSVAGFGTVVTGTLLDGSLTVGQEIHLMPGGRQGRVRGLQSHNQTLSTATPGRRVAVNVSGVERDQVRRGDLLTVPDAIEPTHLVSVRFRHLGSASRPLNHNAEVKVFVGSAETVATARVLDGDALVPGQEGWLQLELRHPLPLLRGDRFILRYPSPGETIGGGEVIDPRDSRRLRRNRADIISRLEALSQGDPVDLIAAAMNTAGKPLLLADIATAAQLPESVTVEALQEARQRDLVVALVDGYFISSGALHALFEQMTRSLTGFHHAHRLRRGMRPDALRGQVNLTTAEFAAVLPVAIEAGRLIRTDRGLIALPTHDAKPTRAQQQAIDRLAAAFEASPYTPPSVKESLDMVGDEVLAALVENGDLRQLNAEVLLTRGVLAEMINATRELLATTGLVNVRLLRDRFNTSRKYALAVLEYLNSLSITRRAGDDHVVASGAWERVI